MVKISLNLNVDTVVEWHHGIVGAQRISVMSVINDNVRVIM
jgi:hypothetical protein